MCMSYLIHSWGEKRWINVFPESICVKVNATDSTKIWTQLVDSTFCTLCTSTEDLFQLAFSFNGHLFSPISLLNWRFTLNLFTTWLYFISLLFQVCLFLSDEIVLCKFGMFLSERFLILPTALCLKKAFHLNRLCV